MPPPRPRSRRHHAAQCRGAEGRQRAHRLKRSCGPPCSPTARAGSIPARWAKTRGFGQVGASHSQSHYRCRPTPDALGQHQPRPPRPTMWTAPSPRWLQSQYDQTGSGTGKRALCGLDDGPATSRASRSTRAQRDQPHDRAHVQQNSASTVNLGKVDMLETDFGNIEVQLSQHVNASSIPPAPPPSSSPWAGRSTTCNCAGAMRAA